MSRPLHAVLAILAATLPGSGFAQSVDISGLPLFWKVYDHLVLGQEPPPRLLDSLFSTPGYAALEQRERRRARLTEAIRPPWSRRLPHHRSASFCSPGMGGGIRTW
jgi:hypothetical protein